MLLTKDSIISQINGGTGAELGLDAVRGTVCRAIAMSWSFSRQHPIVGGTVNVSSCKDY
jgi:hypothetical protein